MSKVIKY